jgi:LPS sulfotransferase NodH
LPVTGNSGEATSASSGEGVVSAMRHHRGMTDGGAAHSYLLCGVQRTGSWMLCHALEDTGVAGIPAEYFHRGDEPFWSERFGTSTDAEFFKAVLSQSTPNGVFGSKMMWNYFDETLARMRSLLPKADAPDDPAVLSAFLPNLRYLWLRRRDFVRQGVSWWRAVHTNQYAVTDDHSVAAMPDYDFAEINRLVEYAQRCDERWQDWFAQHTIEPLTLFYEDIVDELSAAVVAVLAFLQIEHLPDLPAIRPRMQRQADEASERVVARFVAEAAAMMTR